MTAARFPNLKSGIALAAALLLSHSANALRSNTPEYFYQPNVNSIAVAVEGRQMMSGTSTRYINGARFDEVKYGSTGYNFTFGYGFSEAWAFTARLGTENTSRDFLDTAGTPSSERTSGMNDWLVMLTNITPIGGWSLNVGVGAGISPGAHTDPRTGIEGNNLSGGTSVTNYVGLSTTVGSGNYFGFKGQYLARMQRSANTNQTPAVEYVITGGHEASAGAFYEWGFSPGSMDVSLEYQVVDPSLRTFPTGTNTVDGSKNVIWSAGLQYQVSQSANFRLQYTMGMYPEVVDAGVATGGHSKSWGSARIRFEF